MRKILVIGSPGAGKTTFSRTLAKKLQIPLHHLDFYYHDDRFSYRQDTDAWRRKVAELVQQPSWIIDGNYKSTFDIRFPYADTIIYLDYPRSLTIWRALKRRITLHGKVRNDMPSNWTEKFTWQLFRFIWSYNKEQRPKVYKLLQDNHIKGDVVILHSPSNAEHYLLDIS